MVKPLLKKVTNAQLLLCELLLRIGLHDTLAFFSWYNAMCALRISLMLNINTTEKLGMQPVLHKLSLLDHDDNCCGTVTYNTSKIGLGVHLSHVHTRNFSGDTRSKMYP